MTQPQPDCAVEVTPSSAMDIADLPDLPPVQTATLATPVSHISHMYSLAAAAPAFRPFLSWPPCYPLIWRGRMLHPTPNTAIETATLNRCVRLQLRAVLAVL